MNRNLHDSGCRRVKVDKNLVKVDTVLSTEWPNLQVPTNNTIDRISVIEDTGTLVVLMKMTTLLVRD